MTNYPETQSAHVIASTGVSCYRALTDHAVAIGDNKQDKAWMPARAASYHPNKVYILFGLNDLCWGDQMSAQTYTGYYGRLVDSIRSQCPGAKIYIQSITPISAKAENSKDWPFDNARVNEFNAALKTMCAGKDLPYLDIASLFRGPDGKMTAGISDDGVHFRSKEYKMWFSYLLSHQ